VISRWGSEVGVSLLTGGLGVKRREARFSTIVSPMAPSMV
jgi:hypothetical protein